MKPQIALNFHGIGTPARAMEPGEAPYWIGRAMFEQVLDRVARTPGAYVLTFDDGNLSDHDIALPALLARGLVARFFVLAGRIGQAGSLDVSHIRALRDAGMTIGSHGVAHRVWPKLDHAALRDELARSKAMLEEICGAPVTEAAIPFGRYDARVLRALRAAGYGTAWSSDGGTFSAEEFPAPRSSLRGDMKPDTLDAILAGRMPALRRLRRRLGLMRRRHLPPAFRAMSGETASPG